MAEVGSTPTPGSKKRPSHSPTRNQGNLGERAPAGHASMQAIQRMHSESLNFFQSKSKIGICMGQAVSHSLQFEHLIGSRCIPSKLFFWKTAIIPPTGQMYRHQNLGIRHAAYTNPMRIRMLIHVRTEMPP